jgi:hypothetical protein
MGLINHTNIEAATAEDWSKEYCDLIFPSK